MARASRSAVSRQILECTRHPQQEGRFRVADIGERLAAAVLRLFEQLIRVHPPRSKCKVKPCSRGVCVKAGLPIVAAFESEGGCSITINPPTITGGRTVMANRLSMQSTQ